MPAIIRYNPWSMLRGIQEDVNHLFNHNLGEKGASQWTPQVDITEEKDRYRVIADIPGVNPKDIKLSVENDMITIQGERQSESKKEKEGYSRIERFTGNFYRQFSLPETADAQKIQAKTKHGVLEVIIPKKEVGSINKAINIQIEEGD
jgi:HSP20 family protein